jgi:hypothetical protein
MWGDDMAKPRQKRIYQNKMWPAARLYCKEAEKCTKARAYFMAMVARGCELEALLRIFDFVENRGSKDRSYNLNGLIDRAFKRHWIPHDALRYWKKAEHTPLKACLHAIREARKFTHICFKNNWSRVERWQTSRSSCTPCILSSRRRTHGIS